MAQEETTFILIIGGGPVGLTLALDLGQRHVPTILVNENLVTTKSPKCGYINIRAMEHFRKLGIAGEIRGSRPRGPFPLRMSYRTQFCGYEYGSTDVTFTPEQSEKSPEDPQAVLQKSLEPLIKAHVEQQACVDVRFGWRATELFADAEGAQATITDVTTGEQRTVRARYLIGCDGPYSMVRELIGAKLVGKDGAVERRFLSGTKMIYYVRSKDLQARIGSPPATLVWAINRDVRGLVMAYNEEDHFIVQYQVPPHVQWQDVRAREVLDRIFGTGVNYEILSADYWEGGVAKVADSYRRHSVFLAGDAAHRLSPIGGFGMNTGIGDAVNLGWKLAAMHQGWGADGLLDSYGDERQEIGIRNSLVGVHAAERKDRWVVPVDAENDTPQAAANRRKFGELAVKDDREEHYTLGLQLGGRYVSSIIVEPSDVAGSDPWDRYIPSDDGGGRLPHFFLEDGQSIFDVLGNDFALIVFGDLNVTDFERAAAQRHVPLRVVRRSRRDYPFVHDLILVRPDLHIAWSADEFPADLYVILDGIRGALA